MSKRFAAVHRRQLLGAGFAGPTPALSGQERTSRLARPGRAQAIRATAVTGPTPGGTVNQAGISG